MRILGWLTLIFALIGGAGSLVTIPLLLPLDGLVAVYGYLLLRSAGDFNHCAIDDRVASWQDALWSLRLSFIIQLVLLIATVVGLPLLVVGTVIADRR